MRALTTRASRLRSASACRSAPRAPRQRLGSYATVLIAERDENGRLHSEIEAEQKALEEAKEVMTLNRMITLWDGARRTAGKASERVLKEGVRWLGYVTKHIGEIPIKDITPQMVEATYAAIREEHGITRERKAFRGLHHVGNVTAVRLGLATGMRRGEVFAVT